MSNPFSNLLRGNGANAEHRQVNLSNGSGAVTENTPGKKERKKRGIKYPHLVQFALTQEMRDGLERATANDIWDTSTYLRHALYRALVQDGFVVPIPR